MQKVIKFSQVHFHNKVLCSILFCFKE